MPTIIVKDDPLVSQKEIHESPREFLTEALLDLYPDGFKQETRVYIDSPSEENEIDLKNLEEDYLLEEESIVWVCHFPKAVGIGWLIFGAGAVYVGSKIVEEVSEDIADNQQAQIESAISAAQASIEAEIPDETDIDSKTAGIGTSSNNVVSSQSNTIRLAQKIPQIYGDVRAFPDLLGDAYNFFSTEDASTGDQTLYQYFAISEGRIFISPLLTFPSITFLPHSPRIGNQPISEFAISDDEDSEFSLILESPGEEFFYNDYVNHTKGNDSSDIWPDFLSGDFMEIDQGSSISLDIDTDASGDGTIRISTGAYLSSGIGPYGLFIGVLNGNFNPGDEFELYNSTDGFFNSVFKVDKVLMNRSTVGGPENHYVEFEIRGATGNLINNNSSNSGPTEKFYFYNATGSLRGNRVRTGTPPNPNVPDSDAADSETLYALNKRAQDSSEDEFAIFNLNFTRGLRLNLGKTNVNSSLIAPYEAKYEIQIVELDSSNTPIGDIGSPVSINNRIPGSPTNITLKVATASVDGRYVGAEIKRVDDEYPHNSPFTNGDDVDSPPRVFTDVRSSIIEAGYLTERDTFSNDNISIYTMIRRNTKGSDKQPTGKFNAKFGRSHYEFFDFDTGEWVAQNPANPTQFTKTDDWHQTFMWHANKVGGIEIEDIDYEILDEINDDLLVQNGETTRFDFTFSNKNSNLDDELALICSSVRVILYKDGSKYKFSRDQSKIKIGNITSRNVTMESNSKFVKLSLPNPEDGIELEFTNFETDKNEIIYIPENRSALRPKRMFLSGVSNYDMAWRRANYEYLKLFSQRVSRSITTTKEAMLWDLMDRVTVYDHTRLSVVKPLIEAEGFFRQETEALDVIDEVIIGSEKITIDGAMAMELNLDLPDGSGLGVVQNILISVDADDARNFTIDDSVDAQLKSDILDQLRLVGDADLRQIGERILIYPASITTTQLEQDDYLILSKVPEGETIRMELIRYNEDLYQFDSQSPS